MAGECALHRRKSSFCRTAATRQIPANAKNYGNLSALSWLASDRFMILSPAGAEAGSILGWRRFEMALERLAQNIRAIEAAGGGNFFKASCGVLQLASHEQCVELAFQRRIVACSCKPKSAHAFDIRLHAGCDELELILALRRQKPVGGSEDIHDSNQVELANGRGSRGVRRAEGLNSCGSKERLP